ncbi:MAG: imidazole glycerol phosphate synthase subunit HisF [Candidatus Coatesbacteria bacterium]|nr:imidazole glycerol phosphate synthase subunit HisF [Candidatus Coatesbacteria bacterium]
MLAKRIIPCLDVMNDKVVKGVKFRNHEVVGDILELALLYCEQGADELVFYDITASPENRVTGREWLSRIAEFLDIPFCVAGGISSVRQAEEILHSGADKISINTPAIQNPSFINELVQIFGSQCVVIGIDSSFHGSDFYVHKYTGDTRKSTKTDLKTFDWIKEVQDRGAGEIVLNCMDMDGTREGYDIIQLKKAKELCYVPLIASGGAGKCEDFLDLFKSTGVDGALAAGIFHRKTVIIRELKEFLFKEGIHVRR